MLSRFGDLPTHRLLDPIRSQTHHGVGVCPAFLNKYFRPAFKKHIHPTILVHPAAIGIFIGQPDLDTFDPRFVLIQCRNQP